MRPVSIGYVATLSNADISDGRQRRRAGYRKARHNGRYRFGSGYFHDYRP
jgi:hypothetical protein